MKKIIALIILAGLSLTACLGEGTPESVKEDRQVASRQLDRYQRSQPVPEFDWSQLRQNLIEITEAQVQTTQTTSFFFNLGVADPISSCPSIGFPIPTTYQLTNPVQAIGDIGDNGSGAVVAQLEQNGVYSGESTGTYVICTSPTGDAYALYWEGFVSTVAGPAIWEDGQIVLIGDPSFDFSEGR